MSEVEQLRSRWSRLDPRMSPLSSLGVLTLALLSQDTLPGCSLLTGLVILVSPYGIACLYSALLPEGKDI